MAWLNRLAIPDAVRRPRCEVTAFPGVAKENQLPPGGTRLTGLIERLRTTKTLQSPAGTFELTCTWETPPGFTRSLGRIIVPGNIVEIALDAGLPDSTMEVVMRGWVGGVEESETMDGRGRPVRSISIMGEDCGRFFLRHDFAGYLFSAFTWGDPEATKQVNELITMGGPPGPLLRQLFLTIFQKVTPIMAVSEEGQLLTEPILEEGATTSMGPDEDSWPGEMPVDAVWAKNGKFWSVFCQYIDSPWNQAFGDFIPNPATSHYKDYNLADPKGVMTGLLGASGGAGYYLIVRRQPFSEARWNALPTTMIFDSEVKLARTRISDDERINLVMVQPFGHGYNSMADVLHQAADWRNLLRDPDSMKRYGIHMLQARTVYFPIVNGSQDPEAINQYTAGQGDMAAGIARRTDALWRWNSINHLLRSGAMVVAGMPYVRIGERVTGQGTDFPSAYFTDVEQIRHTFYVERVVQEYVEGASYLTHMALTRGQPPGSFITALREGIELVVSAFTNIAGL